MPPSPPPGTLSEGTDVTHARIAQAEVQLLILKSEVVDKAVRLGMEQLCIDLHSQTHRLQEAEQRISTVEEQLQQVNALVSSHMELPEYLLDKVEDLENMSHRNNLRIVGLPESYKPASLTSFRTPHADVCRHNGMSRRKGLPVCPCLPAGGGSDRSPPCLQQSD